MDIISLTKCNNNPLYSETVWRLVTCDGKISLASLSQLMISDAVYAFVPTLHEFLVNAVVLSCLTLLWPHGLQPIGLLCPWDFPGKNPGVGCHFLLQGFFPNQESNSRLLHWQVDSLPARRQGSPNSLLQWANEKTGKTKEGKKENHQT